MSSYAFAGLELKQKGFFPVAAFWQYDSLLSFHKQQILPTLSFQSKTEFCLY